MLGSKYVTSECMGIPRRCLTLPLLSYPAFSCLYIVGKTLIPKRRKNDIRKISVAKEQLKLKGVRQV